MPHSNYNKTLNQKLLWHLKLFVSAVILTFLFTAILYGPIKPVQMIMPFFLTFFQLEAFIWLGNWFFKPLKIESPDFKRQVITRLLLFYLLALFLAAVLFLVVFAVQFMIHFDDFSLFFTTLVNLEIKGFLTGILIGFGIGALFFFYVQWKEAVDRAQKLREEKLIFQYETLQSQVNPHFLFNSLNTLVSLVQTEPELSEDFVRKLSSVYRYILDNREKELVPVSEELGFVNNYFYLQKIRDNEKIELKVEINIDKNALIVPVSLQLLVENALKHNISTRNQPLEITIHNEGIDKLVVRNNLQKKSQLENSSKIGLKNLNERCRLILKRETEILETAEEFIVKIPIKLD